MAGQYNNFVERMKTLDMRVESSLDEFLNTKHFRFSCKYGHQSDIEANAMRNKLAPKSMEKLVSVCAKCNRRLPILERITNRLTELNFTLVSLDEDNLSITYKCHCGSENRSNTKNMYKEDKKSVCPKCQNNPNKADYNEIKRLFSENKCELLTPPHEYQNNKQKLRFRCVCGSESEIVYNDIKRGRLCMSCKSDRTRETSLSVYGVDNPSKSEEIKKKIQNTNIERHGVPFSQQNPEIHAKTEATCEEKYGVKWVFTLPEVYEKIRKTHLEKYGKEYPLQVKEIQDKIDMVCVAVWGARRPCMSDKMKEMMREKFGVDFMIHTAESRKTAKKRMLDQYGSEYFVNSDEMKRVMTEKYGAPSAMQCPEIFRKHQSHSYKRRPYICPDGKTFMILGYEDTCLTQLFEQEGHKILYAGEDPEIPVVKYSDKDGKQHCYYPDIYLPDENRLIEVKSTYLFFRDRDRNIAKAREASNHFKFEFMIYNTKKQLIHRSVISQCNIISQEGEELFTQEELSV